MKADITIVREDSDTKGRYRATVDGVAEPAELHFSKAGPALLIANHTRVPASMRGTGVGLALVERLVADARRDRVRITPLCPFVKAQYRRHPEWSDVMQG